MRKLVGAIIIVLIALVVWLGLCLWQDWIAKASYNGLAWAFGGLWIGMVGIGDWIRTTASVTNTAFLFYTVIILGVSVFFWAGLRKLWGWGATHRPHLRTPSISSASSTVASTTGIRTTTPAGATTRPTTTTLQPVANEVIVEEEEVTEA